MSLADDSSSMLADRTRAHETAGRAATIIVDSRPWKGESARSLVDSSHECAIGLKVSARLTEPIG